MGSREGAFARNCSRVTLERSQASRSRDILQISSGRELPSHGRLQHLTGRASTLTHGFLTVQIENCVFKLRRKGPAPFHGILGTIRPTKHESYALHLCLHLTESLFNVSYLDKDVIALPEVLISFLHC